MAATKLWTIALFACCSCLRLASADEGAVNEAFAQFAGTWRIVGSEPGRIDTLPEHEPDERLLGADVAFEPDRVIAPGSLGCGNAAYAVQPMPAEGLFQGTLGAQDARARAEALGLSPTAAPTLGVTCDTGVFDYHLSTAPDGHKRLLIMLDRVIYTLEPATD